MPFLFSPLVQVLVMYALITVTIKLLHGKPNVLNRCAISHLKIIAIEEK